MGVCYYKLVDIIECEMKTIKVPSPSSKAQAMIGESLVLIVPHRGGCDSLGQRWNMFLFMSLPSANFLGLQRFYLPFRSNYRLRGRMKWVEMKGLLFFYLLEFQPLGKINTGWINQCLQPQEWREGKEPEIRGSH